MQDLALLLSGCIYCIFSLLCSSSTGLFVTTRTKFSMSSCLNSQTCSYFRPLFLFSLWNALSLRTTWLFLSLLWTELFICWSPNPSTSECNYIWRNYLLRSVSKEEAVKGGALIHMTDSLLRREKSRTDVCAQSKVHVRTQQEASHLQAKERVFREKPNPLIPWSCLSSIQYYEKINFCFLSHSSLVLCYGDPNKLIHSP